MESSLKDQPLKVDNTTFQHCLQRVARVLEQVQYFPQVKTNKGSKWLNTQGDWSFDVELKGKFVVVLLCSLTSLKSVFFLREIQALEKKLKALKEVVFISWHMPKFQSDQDPALLRQFIVNLDIEHPVVIDCESKILKQMDFSQIPAIMIVAPDNRPIFQTEAEGQVEMVKQMLLAAIHKSKESKNWLLSSQELPIVLERSKMKEELLQDTESGNQTDEQLISLMQNLKHPTKLIFVQVQENEPKLPYPGVTKILIVSDSGNNRFIVLDGSYLTFLDQIGTGFCSFKDGDWDLAHFNRPQGLCHYIKDKQHCLLLCDTQNHLIRSANFHSKKVKTVAGQNGVSAKVQNELLIGCEEAISNPTDIIRYADNNENANARSYCFLVTMAGMNQVWKLDLNTSQLQKFGANDWSQPTGVAQGMFNGNQCYFVADSDSSEIRAIQADGLFTHIVCGRRSEGEQYDGDQEGQSEQTKLQFPQGLSYCQKNGMLYIADTFNHKIQTMRLTGQIANFVEDFVGGPLQDNIRIRDGMGGAARFNQPAGCCVQLDSGGYFLRLYVTDSGNNCIRSISITGYVETPILNGIPDVTD